MIVKLTKEQISILSFATGLYMATALDRKTMTPPDKIKLIKSMEKIIKTLDTATEE